MRRVLAVVCLLAASVGLAVGSGGFSSVDADRTVTVDVVGDENAYMSLTYADSRVTVSDGEEVELVTVTNQFTESVTFEIKDLTTVGDIDATLASHHNGVSVGVGLDEPITVTVSSPSCDGTSTPSYVDGTVEFDVTADGDGVFAETTQKRPVKYRVMC